MSFTTAKILLEDYVQLSKESLNNSQVNDQRNELEKLIRTEWAGRFTDEQNKEFRYYSDEKFFPKS
jgi:hypothetical protein